MGRSPCCSKVGINKGAWSSQEDEILIYHVKIHGEGKWRKVAQNAGLNRCAKSCRLRWLNYLRPGIKRGDITKDEEDLVIRIHWLLGNRWALIAGRLPGRTDYEINNYWNANLAKRFKSFSSRLSCAMKFDQDPGIQDYQNHRTMNHSPVNPNEPLGLCGPGDDDDLRLLMSIDTDFGQGVTDFNPQLYQGDQDAVCQENDSVRIIVSGVNSNDVISSLSPCGYSSLHLSGHSKTRLRAG
ncbi:hypothetical protein BT93_J1949 [Corymbia citriodora subsp. variegata]|nr:hypothetical protein BT93_J1949 [Corymbia citriodora subsp. variegata]